MTDEVLWVMILIRALSALSNTVTARANREAMRLYKTNAKVERVLLVFAFDFCLVLLSFTTGYWQFWAMPAVAWAITVIAAISQLGDRA